MTFHKKRHPVTCRLHLGSEQIVSVNEIRDLGVLFTSNLLFNRHIEISCNKALSMLGFLKRVCFNFRNTDCLKSLYFAFVRSHVEFACVAWSPDYAVHVSRLESVQKKFVMFALRKTYYRSENRFTLPPYITRCNLLSIKPLSQRRDDICCMFVYDLLTNKLDSPSLLSKLDIHVPSRLLRDTHTFRTAFCRTNYSRMEPIRRMCRLFNSVSCSFDFNMSRCKFKSMLKNSN